MNGAPMPSRNLMVSMPRQITTMFSTQNAKKQIQMPADVRRQPGHMIFSIE